MTTTSIQCFSAIRNERRANDLTVEALVREIATSVQTALLKSFFAISEFYTAYHKRQERRRHHYRRAMRTLSFDKNATPAVAASLAPAIAPLATVTDAPELADAHIIHFASYRTRQVATTPAQDDACEIPAAHVCDFAKWASRDATAS